MPVWDHILCDWKGWEAVRLGLYAVTDLTKSPILCDELAEIIVEIVVFDLTSVCYSFSSVSPSFSWRATCWKIEKFTLP